MFHTSEDSKAFWKHFSLKQALRFPIRSTASEGMWGNQQNTDVFNLDQFFGPVHSVSGQLWEEGMLLLQSLLTVL